MLCAAARLGVLPAERVRAAERGPCGRRAGGGGGEVGCVGGRSCRRARALAGRAEYVALPPPGRDSFPSGAGIVVAPPALRTDAGPVAVLLLGVDPADDLRTYRPALPKEIRGVLLERRFAERAEAALDRFPASEWRDALAALPAFAVERAA